MRIVTENWETILVLILAIAGLISFLIKKGGIQKLLVFICIEAERRYGSKTGTVKLRYVYDWFVRRYPIISSLISFKTFSDMVDIALEEMRHLINTNMQIFDYVGGGNDRNDERSI